MAATKSNQTLLAAVTATTTSASVSTAGDYADTVFGTITQTGTATTAASIQVYESPGGSANFYGAPTKQFTAGLAAGTYPFEIAVDPTAGSVKVTYTQQIGGTSSACTAELGQVTGI